MSVIRPQRDGGDQRPKRGPKPKYEFRELSVGGEPLRIPTPRGYDDAIRVRNAASHHFRRIGGGYATKIHPDWNHCEYIHVWRKQ